MGASRQRKYLIAALAAGLGALIFDRALLQPGSASAAQGVEASPAGGAAAPAATAGPRAGAAPESPKTSGSPEAPLASVPGLAARVQELEVPPATADIFRADPGEWGMRPAVPTPQASEVELRLGAIMNSEAGAQGASCALINSRIIRVGGVVAGYTVERITPTTVLLRRGERTRELKLAERGSP